MKKLKKDLISTGYALTTAAMIGRWAIHTAAVERGYDSAGGEYLLILITYIVAYKACEAFVNAMEDKMDEIKERRIRGGAWF